MPDGTLRAHIPLGLALALGRALGLDPREVEACNPPAASRASTRPAAACPRSPWQTTRSAVADPAQLAVAA